MNLMVVLISFFIFVCDVNLGYSLSFEDCVISVQKNPPIFEFKCTDDPKINAMCRKIVRYHQNFVESYFNITVPVNGIDDCDRPSM